ncbi:mCG145863, partial [Mus musculus]
GHPDSARLPRHATDLVRYQNDEWKHQDRGEEQNRKGLELGHTSLRRIHRVKGRLTGGRKDCEAARSFTSLKGGRAVPPDWGRLQLRPPLPGLPAVLGRSHPSGSVGSVCPRTLPPRGRVRRLQISVLGTSPLWRGLDPGTSPLASPLALLWSSVPCRVCRSFCQLKREDPLCTLTCSLLDSGMSQMKNTSL